MKTVISIAMLFLLPSCSCMPELAKTVDDIATDDAIILKIDRDAMKKDPDIHIEVNVINKDPK